MLQDIIDSKEDSAVLGFMLVAPPRAFSIFEIATRLKISHGKTTHVLKSLAEQGLLKSFSKKGKKYFLVNSQYKLLPDIQKQFVRNLPAYKDELFGAVKNLGEIKAAFLSGIFCGQPNLPVDLLLIGRVNLRKLADFLKAAEKMMGQDINYSIMSVREFEIRRDTFDKFIKDIFDYPHLPVFDNIPKKSKIDKK